MKKLFLISLFFITYFCDSQAQTDSTNWLRIKANDLLKADSVKDTYVAIASRKNQILEEAPSIVSVVTRKEIETYGARDLADILRMVPGFDLAVDTDGIFGVGFRGIWAHESKLLLMINGVGSTDLAYGNINLIGSYPSSMIERVEIIRGPGSVLYGGFAEVTVINIITHKANNLRGFRASGNTGVIGKDTKFANTNLSLGLKSDATEVAIHAGIGTNSYSTRLYEAFTGSIPSIQLNAKNSPRETQYLIIDGKVKNFNFNYNYNTLIYNSLNTYVIIPQIDKAYNTVQSMHLDYYAQLGKSITVKPILEYTYAKPIGTPVNAALSRVTQYYNEATFMDKWRAEINSTYKDNIMFGIGTLTDNISSLSKRFGKVGLKLSNNPADTAQNNTVYAYYTYAQYDFKIKSIKFTLGARYENTAFGDAFLPRLSAVYHKNKLNAKLLFSRSFRTPTPFQAYSRALGDGDRNVLKPELASTAELEIGYKFNSFINLKTNLFYVNIDKPIVYVIESYANYGQITSVGIENELTVNYPKYGGFLNFALALPQGETSTNFLSSDKNTFLGFSTYKINMGAYYKIGKLTLAPKLAYLSARSGQTRNYAEGNTPNGDFESQVYDANILVDFNIGYANLFKNIDINIAAYNLFDNDYKLLQPYYGTHAPMPVYDRQFMVGIVWKH